MSAVVGRRRQAPTRAYWDRRRNGLKLDSRTSALFPPKGRRPFHRGLYRRSASAGGPYRQRTNAMVEALPAASARHAQGVIRVFNVSGNALSHQFRASADRVEKE